MHIGILTKHLVENMPQSAVPERQDFSAPETNQNLIEEHRQIMPKVTLGQGTVRKSPTQTPQTTYQPPPLQVCGREPAGVEIPRFFSATRVARHRKMAALYERLAELHREEAMEYLPADERVYTNWVERGNDE